MKPAMQANRHPVKFCQLAGIGVGLSEKNPLVIPADTTAIYPLVHPEAIHAAATMLTDVAARSPDTIAVIPLERNGALRMNAMACTIGWVN
jgi:hypothetical protein